MILSRSKKFKLIRTSGIIFKCDRYNCSVSVSNSGFQSIYALRNRKKAKWFLLYKRKNYTNISQKVSRRKLISTKGKSLNKERNHQDIRSRITGPQSALPSSETRKSSPLRARARQHTFLPLSIYRACAGSGALLARTRERPERERERSEREGKGREAARRRDARNSQWLARASASRSRLSVRYIIPLSRYALCECVCKSVI